MVLRPKPKYDAINAGWFHWRTQNQFISKYEYWIDVYWYEVLQMHYNERRTYRIELLQLIIYSAFIMKLFVDFGHNITSIATWIHYLSGARVWIRENYESASFLASINLSIKIKWYFRYKPEILSLMERIFFWKLKNSHFLIAPVDLVVKYTIGCNRCQIDEKKNEKI